MNIICTKKLEKYLGKDLKNAVPQKDPRLGSWNAHLFTVKRKDCIITVHSETYYSVLLMGIKKTDLPEFHLLFYNRLMEQMVHDGISIAEPLRKQLLEDTAPTFLPSDNNRKVLGTINRFIMEMEVLVDYSFDGSVDASQVKKLNNTLTANLVGALKRKKYDYGVPIEEMKKFVEGMD